MARSGLVTTSRAIGRGVNIDSDIAPGRTVAREDVANTQKGGLIGVFDPHRLMLTGLPAQVTS
jgi:hypothetical protein